MNSRISIEIDHSNQPVIKIDYQPSPDVRDTLVKRFMETFGGKSCYATFFFDNSIQGQINSVAYITPISPKDLEMQAQAMQEINSGIRGSDGPMNGDNL